MSTTVSKLHSVCFLKIYDLLFSQACSLFDGLKLGEYLAAADSEEV